MQNTNHNFNGPVLFPIQQLQNNDLASMEDLKVNFKQENSLLKLPTNLRTNLHVNHRKRLRKRFSGKIDGLHEHEVLEYLLTFAIPRRDTNEMAHELIEKLGSFTAVFDACESQLREVKGIGENCVHLIQFIKKFMSYYSASITKNFKRTSYKDKETLHKYVIQLFLGRIYEVSYMICFDNRMRMKNVILLQEGTLSEVNLYLRDIIKIAIDNLANVVVLAHNHPGGIAVASQSDLMSTKRIREALEMIDVKLLDHILVVDNKAFSMREMNIPSIF